MRSGLSDWSRDANVLQQLSRFDRQGSYDRFSYLRTRRDDYYVSLVGELFERLRSPYENREDWSKLANSLADVGVLFSGSGESAPKEAPLMAAVAFYVGGFSASAYVTLRAFDVDTATPEQRSCYELIAKPRALSAPLVVELIESLRGGRANAIDQIVLASRESADQALAEGPDQWVIRYFLASLLDRFVATNIRAVLPGGDSNFWDPLVESFLDRRPPVWDFFPSQIDAISRGFLSSDSTYSIQMPTGSGKTALTETLLFHHLSANPESVATLLVPFRSLASELKQSVALRLTRMGLSTKSVYGGSVPTGGEVEGLEEIRAIIATPEAMLGVLAADSTISAKVSLVICDEGHLLDSESRGVGLELLLARLLTRPTVHRRFVFISAIVPNVEEINAWLGGAESTVLRSDYKPTPAEFSALLPSGKGNAMRVALNLHPHESADVQYSEAEFLTRNNFSYLNSSTGRQKVYGFSSIKVQAVAAARKALPMGAVAIFAAHKRGNQGAVGIAEELIKQLALPLDLPSPRDLILGNEQVANGIEFLTLEFGRDWVGTRSLGVGAVLHHGDIPQEAREVLETLLRVGHVSLAICTNTLAEGVNLPIRTLVLYSVQRRNATGGVVNFLARDIKNLVGRAGRAGSSTKGLVIAANPAQWSLIEPVARQAVGERVGGALLQLIGDLQRYLIRTGTALSDEVLEGIPELFELTDGVDATLIELAAEEMGDGALASLAAEVASRTFAFRQADESERVLIDRVFQLRADRILALRGDGRIEWVRASGGRLRMLKSVEEFLLPLSGDWEAFDSPTDPVLRSLLVTWAMTLPDVLSAAERTLGAETSPDTVSAIVGTWLSGASYGEMADAADIAVDVLLHAHSALVGYALQVNIEQGVALLGSLLDARGATLANAVKQFPEYLRYGVPTNDARELLARGMRHRRIAIALAEKVQSASVWAILSVGAAATEELRSNEAEWVAEFGRTAFENSLVDLARLP